MTELLNNEPIINNVLLTEVFLAIGLSFVLVYIITLVYQKTYKGNTYSQSFVHTVIIMGVVVSVVMIVIGNNLARAFGLVGALSIIRFRMAMTDPKDIAYIFFAMAVGLACGTGFYTVAISLTFYLCIIIYVMYYFDYGKKTQHKQIVRISVPENLNYENIFDDIFEKYLEEYTLQRVETTNLGTMFELVYLVKSKEGVEHKEFLDAIRERNSNLKVSINLASGTF
ncbi:hypothetical protein SYNTR_1868 [Candidatus Syntrophocurvum alkaliphilum]|uniref:DUF4956 domain-containing protein n=1 Tax=Candidatus Syntrophocurvum alkaliphilum TaxID=2293317 RepID=A0A6I6DD08_9FIRM|nr:DUF4956 domain-containing protein [Candidatus Syntrophocurvum alkaliphilum]QGU00462.1 hypothetical protein SYNTR_1868 [Candidatus Syntrophocurvum alkaliphilum]